MKLNAKLMIFDRVEVGKFGKNKTLQFLYSKYIFFVEDRSQKFQSLEWASSYILKTSAMKHK